MTPVEFPAEQPPDDGDAVKWLRVTIGFLKRGIWPKEGNTLFIEGLEACATELERLRAIENRYEAAESAAEDRRFE